MRLFTRLLSLGALAAVTLTGLTGCTQATSMAVWDADGCGFVVTMYEDVSWRPARHVMNEIGNGRTEVVRAIGMDRPTCVAPAANALAPRPKE